MTSIFVQLKEWIKSFALNADYFRSWIVFLASTFTSVLLSLLTMCEVIS